VTGEPLLEIEIRAQGWLRDEGPDPDRVAATVDLCSHGAVRLTIGGHVISPGADHPREYGVSESALALLRTLEADHSPAHPVAERLIFHGCGALLMMGCPIGIDWRVSHAAGRVQIGDVVRHDTVNEDEGVRFAEIAVELPEDQYRRQVIAFAKKAKEPFEGITKDISDEFDQRMYEEFWREYDARLARAISHP
jgi:hypothetical protein